MVPVFCVVIIGDIYCAPGFSYFYALDTGRHAFVETTSSSGARGACLKDGGILAEGENVNKYLNETCFLEIIGRHNVDRFWDFGKFGDAPSPSFVLCIRKFANSVLY